MNKPLWVGLMFVKHPSINSKRKQEKVCQVKYVKFGYIWKEFPSKALNGLLSLQKRHYLQLSSQTDILRFWHYVKLQTSSEMFQIPGQFINFMPFLNLNCSAIFTGGLPFPILNCFIEPSLAISLKALVDHTKCACSCANFVSAHQNTGTRQRENLQKGVSCGCFWK